MTLPPTHRPQLRRTDHLGWLYLLAVVPLLLHVVENGRFPSSPRRIVSELVMTAFVVVVVNVIVRRSKALADQMAAYVERTEQLQHSNRLATVGQLAAGVAHELGSPLQVIAGRAKMIATGETTGDEAREAGKLILEQSRRMAGIISGLLGFARRQPPQRAMTDLETIARDVHRMLEPIAKKKAVVFELAVTERHEIRVDRQQIQQALTNLVMNALQAVSSGGHVGISVDFHRRLRLPDHSGVGPLPEPARGPIEDVTGLHVVDDGLGIDSKDQLRMFEPFFTTKDVGEGTGLGLAVAHGLVRDNGGWITVESERGHGARFSIYFPCKRGAS